MSSTLKMLFVYDCNFCMAFARYDSINFLISHWTERKKWTSEVCVYMRWRGIKRLIWKREKIVDRDCLFTFFLFLASAFREWKEKCEGFYMEMIFVLSHYNPCNRLCIHISILIVRLIRIWERKILAILPPECVYTLS